jgi:transcriptional regulator with XRE-family HTH domain
LVLSYPIVSTQATTQIALRVGANLREAREARGLTQQEVGVAIQATGGGRDVSRWENGHVEVGPKYRQALADLLFDGDLSALYRERVPA